MPEVSNVEPISRNFTTYYCKKCLWHHTEMVKFAMYPECPDCGSTLHWINYRTDEIPKVEEILGYKVRENARRSVTG
jgi:ribosomal protein L34E